MKDSALLKILLNLAKTISDLVNFWEHKVFFTKVLTSIYSLCVEKPENYILLLDHGFKIASEKLCHISFVQYEKRFDYTLNPSVKNNFEKTVNLNKTLHKKKSIENVLDYLQENLDINFFSSFQDSSLLARKESIVKLKTLLQTIQKDLNCSEAQIAGILKESPL